MKRLPSFSQNFLRSPQLVKELVGHTNIGKNDVVYDIGAGSGVVTSVLAHAAHSVVAVEIDPRMAEKLRTNMQKFDNVVVYQADFMALPLPHTPYKVFANIPFSLSSQIVHRLTETAYPPAATYLIVQEQFARKLLPDNKGYTNQLAISLGAEFAVRVRRKLRPTDFYPHPKVPTVLLEVVRRSQPLIAKQDLPMFKQFVTGAFTDPRKLWRAPLHDAGFSATAAPSSLTLEQWVQLFTLMRNAPRKHGMALVEAGDPILLVTAAPVATTELNSPSIRFVIDRLLEYAVRSRNGASAPHIGVSRRIVALGNPRPAILVNPQITSRVKDGFAVSALDKSGKPLKMRLEGAVARDAERLIQSLN